MNGDQKLTTLFSLAMVLATMVLGWFSYQDYFSLPPIAAVRAPGQVPASEQDITARLWEDPLQAIQMELAKDTGKHQHEAHEVANLQEAIRQELEKKESEKANQVCLLTVLIPGTPFPDDVETRLRMRYSLQMAMARAQCVPLDRNHLGYLRIAWPGAEGVHGPRSGQGHGKDFWLLHDNKVHLPYEWFSSQKKPGLKVLTLWLPEELLGDEPLCRLAYLRKSLLCQPSQPGQCLGPLVIGPRSSDALVAMVPDGSLTNDHCCYTLLRTNLCIFSPAATAPDGLLGITPTNYWPEARMDMNKRLCRQLSPGQNDWQYFQNFIAPDDQLTDLLVQELGLRRIHPGTNGNDRVLLLIEADTSYGRSLPLAFQASLEPDCHRNLANSESGTAIVLDTYRGKPPSLNSNLVIARYLQGLDAQKGFQSEPTTAKDRSKSAEQQLENALSRKAAASLGESQLDYAERLAEQLAQHDLTRQVKAVGILGSDIYDKLILLRSLRSRFRQALFFTTDLDARLWQPDYFKFTRNLVVASAHNLWVSPPDSLSPTMAPFRDAYQVAFFHACTAAMTKASDNKEPLPSLRLTPAIYEIGRRGYVTLNPLVQPNGGPANSPWASASLVSLGGLLLWALLRSWRYPATTPSFWMVLIALGTMGWLTVISKRAGQDSVWAVCCISAALWLLLGIAQLRGSRGPSQFNGAYGPPSGWAGVAVPATLIVLTLFGSFAFSQSRHPGGEPWSWRDGVSIWPTELVRILAICAMIWMLVWSWKRHRAYCGKLNDEFDFGMPQANGAYNGRQGCIERVAQPWPAPLQTVRNSRPIISAVDVFQCYLTKASLGARGVRVTVAAMIYVLLVLAVFVSGTMLDPHIRAGAYKTDRLVLGIAIFTWLVLIFYVLDAVFLTARTLLQISEPFTLWPDALLHKHAQQLGVLRRDLEGFLDVKFAAYKTQEVGKLVLLPFLIQFLMLVARNSYFDNWNWPPPLLFIFVSNFALCGTAWIVLRRAARRVRSNALQHLEEALLGIKLAAASSPKPAAPTSGREIGLQEIKRQIEALKCGAYSRWMQDPAVLAMLIPTGMFGILSVLFQALFGQM